MAEGIQKDEEGAVTVTAGKRSFCCMFIAIIILIIILIILIIALATKNFGRWEPKTCDSVACITAAASMADYMDTKAKPCDDFYQYACGGFMQKTTLASHEGERGPAADATSKIYKKCKPLLEKKEETSEVESIKATKRYYKSCMDTATIDKLGIQPMKDYVDGAGGWAVLKWEESKFDMEDMVGQLGWDFVTAVGMVSADVNSNDATQNILMLTQVYIDKRLPAPPVKDVYEKLAIDLAVEFGAAKTTATTEMKKVVAFEQELIKILVAPADRVKPANTKITTMGKIMTDYPGFDWKKMMTKALSKSNVTIDDNTTIKLMDIPYFEKIGDLLKNTAKRTLSTHFMWRNIFAFIDYTDSKTRDLAKDLSKLLTGLSTDPPRYETCVQKVLGFSMTGYSMTRMFADAHPIDTAEVDEMAMKVRNVFIENLETNDWMDAESKKAAEEKADAMLFNMAYPSFVTNDEELTKKYGTLAKTIEVAKFFENSIALTRAELSKIYAKANTKVDRSEWPMIPLMVNAANHLSKNAVFFLLGFMQPPFYQDKAMKAVNFGATGFFLGHEVTHGFDSQGGNYDKDGNMKAWMTKQTSENFQKKSKCVEEEFSKMTVKQVDKKVNGALTLGENIADLGAIKQGFKAYKAWVDEHGEEKSLPGVDLTNEQVYFVSFAQVFCQLATDEVMKNKLNTDPHTPNRERVYGTLINTPEFSETFNCPSGSPMNPEKKCTVW